MLPKTKPINFTKFLKNENVKWLNNKLYKKFIDKHVVKKNLIKPVAGEYFIWQDDEDKKHRTKFVLDYMRRVTPSGTEPTDMAPKMADI